MSDELRIVAIGDLHGHDHLLKPLLKQIETTYLDSGTSVVFMGDYLNRSPGPEACRATLERVAEFENKHPNQTFLLRGNHEWNFLQMVEYEIDHLHITKPWELEIYKEYTKLIQSTLPFYETERYFFAHAGGVMKNHRLARREETDEERFALYWRYDLEDRQYEKTVVRAHQIVEPDKVFGKHTISIDLGTYKTGKLGAVILPDNLLIVSG